MPRVPANGPTAFFCSHPAGGVCGTHALVLALLPPFCTEDIHGMTGMTGDVVGCGVLLRSTFVLISARVSQDSCRKSNSII